MDHDVGLQLTLAILSMHTLLHIHKMNAIRDSMWIVDSGIPAKWLTITEVFHKEDNEKHCLTVTDCV